MAEQTHELILCTGQDGPRHSPIVGTFQLIRPLVYPDRDDEYRVFFNALQTIHRDMPKYTGPIWGFYVEEIPG